MTRMSSHPRFSPPPFSRPLAHVRRCSFSSQSELVIQLEMLNCQAHMRSREGQHPRSITAICTRTSKAKDASHWLAVRSPPSPQPLRPIATVAQDSLSRLSSLLPTRATMVQTGTNNAIVLDSTRPTRNEVAASKKISR